MVKKTDIFSDEFEEIPEEKLELEEIKLEKAEPEKPEVNTKIKDPFKVLMVGNDYLILSDKHENGIKIQTPTEYKNSKKGDIIYL